MNAAPFRWAGIVLLVLAVAVLLGMITSGDVHPSWLALTSAAGGGIGLLMRARDLDRQGPQRD